jgi:DNA-binding MarR family transcriptional regulator
MDSIRRIVQVLRVGSRAAERDVGLSAAQLFVLERLASSDRSLSVNELAERTLTHQSSVSVVVKKLEHRGLIERAAAAEDARRAELSLAPAAEKLLRKAPPAAQDRILFALAQMTGGDRRSLARLLGDLAQRVSDGEAPAMFFEDSPHKPRKPGRARTRS